MSIDLRGILRLGSVWAQDFPPVSADRADDALRVFNSSLPFCLSDGQRSKILRTFLHDYARRERERVFTATDQYFYWTKELYSPMRSLGVAQARSDAELAEELGLTSAYDDEDDYFASDELARCDVMRCFPILDPVSRRTLLREFVPAEVVPGLEIVRPRYAEVLDALRVLRALVNGDAAECLSAR